jgi:hypothetical protein
VCSLCLWDELLGCFTGSFVGKRILCVGNVCGVKGMIYYGCSFVGRCELGRKVHCCSGKVLPVADGSQ